MAIGPATTPVPAVLALGQSHMADEEIPIPIGTERKHMLAEDARLRIHLDDLDHQSTGPLVLALDLSKVLRYAIDRVHEHLYKPYGRPQIVRSVTLILRRESGVAYTSGTPLDEQHKEIVFALDYLDNFIDKPHRLRDEATGVITHEMVHCFQHDCKGTAPWWLIEGVADFVRLKSGLAPPHWDKGKDEESRGKSWDEGYQKTAWFLEFLERKFGPGSISRMNATMRDTKYEESEFWPKVFNGKTVKELWERYKLTWDSAFEDRIRQSVHQEGAVIIARETIDYTKELQATAFDLAHNAADCFDQERHSTAKPHVEDHSQLPLQDVSPLSNAGSEAEVVELNESERAEAARQN